MQTKYHHRGERVRGTDTTRPGLHGVRPTTQRIPDSWSEPRRAVTATEVADLFGISVRAARRFLEGSVHRVGPDRYAASDVMRLLGVPPGAKRLPQSR